MDLLPYQLFLFFATAFFAEVIDSVIGFGSMLLLVPLTSLFLPISEAVVLSGLFHLFGSLARTTIYARYVDRTVLVRFGLPAALAAPVGAILLPTIDASILRMILGLILIFYAVFSLLHHRMHLHKRPLTLTLSGAFSGFITGLLGTTGLIQGAVLTSLALTNRTYLATIAGIALVIDISRVFVYQSIGLLNVTGNYVAALLFVAILGAVMGKRIVHDIDKRTEKRIIFIALMLAGSYFLFTKV